MELIENKRDTRGQKGQSRRQKGKSRRGKAESRMHRAERERQKGRESARRKDIEALDEDGVENSRLMLLHISYSVKSFYGTSI